MDSESEHCGRQSDGSKLPVGGQAVIEGVMMRSPNCFAVAVRTPGGSIIVRQRKWISLAKRWKFLRWPFFRGILTLGETLHNGISALNFSASVQEQSMDAEEKPAALWLTMGVAILLALGLFAALPHFLTWGLGKLMDTDSLASGRALEFHVVDGIIKLAIFIGYIAGISMIAEIRRVFMFHGAEHKSIYAHENGEELTVENARKYTTLHPRCGTAFLLVVLFIAIVVFSVVFPLVPPVSDYGFLNQLFFVFVKLLLLFPIAGMSYEVIKKAGKHPDHRLLRAAVWPGLVMQRLTTQEPDDLQLEVAITSLKTVLAAEERYVASPDEEVEESQVEFESFAAFVESLEEVPDVPEAQ